MLVWFAGGSAWAAWMVFRDPALAYSVVAIGALLPDVVALLGAGSGPGHSIVVGGLLLVAVMLGTRGRRRLRRRLLGIPLGFLLHLVLDAAWAEPVSQLWWPLAGAATGSGVPSLSRPLLLLLLLEVAGLLLGFVTWRDVRSIRQARRSRRGVEPAPE